MSTSLIDFRTLPVGLRDAGRVAAITELATGKFTVSEVAERYGTTTISIRKWREIADAKGVQALTEHKRGRKHL